MTVHSIGDQARAFALQAASNRIKTTLSVLTSELASGEVADLGARLQGNTQGIAEISSRLAMLSQFRQNATEAAAQARGVTDVLDSIRHLTGEVSLNLFVEPAGESETLIAVRSTEAAGAFETVVNRLNGAVGQRYLFAGTQSDVPPLASSAEMLTHLQAVTLGMTTASDIATAVSAWFDAAPGGGGFLDLAYGGSIARGQTLAVGEDTKIILATTAATPAIREQLKGLATAALVSRGALSGQLQEQRELLQQGGKLLLDGSASLASEMAQVGYTQQLIEYAQTEGSAATATLEIMRNEFRQADPYATSTAITEAETHLDALYAVTARLSKLRLVDYLR